MLLRFLGDLGVEVPLWFARARIKSEHLVALRAHVESVPDLLRRVLKGVGCRIAGRLITGIEFPGNVQLIDIMWRDLVGAGEALGQVAAPIGDPIGCLGRAWLTLLPGDGGGWIDGTGFAH